MRRPQDIPVLVEYFIDRYARKAGKRILGINKNSLELLQSYPWPGNIRELQNVIERSVIVCSTENFSVDESWLSRQPLAMEPKSQPQLSHKRRRGTRDHRACPARNRRTGLRTFRRGNQAGHSRFYPGLKDQVAQDRQESIQINRPQPNTKYLPHYGLTAGYESSEISGIRKFANFANWSLI